MRLLSPRLVAAAAIVVAGTSACTSTPSEPVAAPDAVAVGQSTTTTAPVGATRSVALEPRRERSGSQVAVSFAPGGVIEDQLDDLIAVTERLRGHEFVERPVVRFVSSIEAARLRGLAGLGAGTAFGTEPEAALLELLGVLGERPELGGFTSGVAEAADDAFYDYEYADLIVPLEGQILSPYEQWVLVHQLTHALMHQTFPETAHAFLTATDGRSDAPSALAALIEGEAVLIQTLFFAELAPAEQQAVLNDATSRASDAMRDAPAFLRTVTRFPFTDGADFAVDLYGRGGLVALDQAFARPPWTTEHVLHPERYVALESSVPDALPAIRLASYEVAELGVWGELRWRALLAGTLNGGVVDRAASGWRNDRYMLLWNEHDSQVAWVARVEAASARDASELAGALIDLVADGLHLPRRLVAGSTEDFVGDDYAAIARSGSTVTFVIASNPAAGLRVADQLGLIPDGFVDFPVAEEVEG